MNEEPMKTENSSPLTPRQQAELKAPAALPDDQIDTKSIPEQRDWTSA